MKTEKYLTDVTNIEAYQDWLDMGGYLLNAGDGTPSDIHLAQVDGKQEALDFGRTEEQVDRIDADNGGNDTELKHVELDTLAEAAISKRRSGCTRKQSSKLNFNNAYKNERERLWTLKKL
jgi:hypothetical protein